MTEETIAKSLKGLLRNRCHATYPGWLTPTLAYQFYQHGQVKQLINRFTTLMVKAGYDYIRANVPGFNWAPTESKLETLDLPTNMKLAATWAFVFGGAAIEHIVEDGGRDSSEELEPANVHAYKGMKVWSAYGLRPVNGNYKTAEFFEPRYGAGMGRKIHRSRLSIVVVEDVPDAAQWGATGLLNTTTQWPPSWLEGIHDAFCGLKYAHQDADTLLEAKSILHLKLQGWRKVKTSPNAPEAEEAEAALAATLEEVNNSGAVVTDTTDGLVEVSRDLAHVADLIERKELWFASSAGVPKELVVMEAEGNLGTNSAPIDANNDMVDGWRTTMYTPVINDSTDLALAAQAYQAMAAHDPIDVPTEYTVKHRAIEETSEKDDAEARDKNASAREKDAKSGVPQEVLLTDPKLMDDYPGMAAYLEQREEARKLSKAKTIAQAEQHPEGEDMVSAAEIARKLGTSPGTIIAMAQSGTIPGQKIGARWKFYLSRVIEAVSSNEVATAEAASEDRRRSDSAALDSELGLSSSSSFGDVYGASVAMREIFAVLERVRDYDMPVLILGETGTGKEGIARGLHRGGPFEAVNCAALGSDADDVAKAVEQAAASAMGGSLFLDEVGDLSPEGQSAILRVLSTMSPAVSGETGQELSPPRVMSATSLDIREGWAFRPDLYYRLAGVEVEVPPLRDREEDVHWLARMFYERAVAAIGHEAASPMFTPSALAAMLVYRWPGNIRELRSAVERGIALAGRARPVGVEHLQIRQR